MLVVVKCEASNTPIQFQWAAVLKETQIYRHFTSKARNSDGKPFIGWQFDYGPIRTKPISISIEIDKSYSTVFIVKL